MGAVGLALTVTVLLGAGQMSAEGEGHTPVDVCHWVPAKDGSYVFLTVDDDGATGNKNLEAHYGHENDIFVPEGVECPAQQGEEPD
jgi:hypothetical protein